MSYSISVKIITGIILASLLIALPLQQGMGEEWVTVKSWKSSGTLTTEKFEIKSTSWRIYWKAVPTDSVNLFQIYIYGYDSVDVAANVIVKETKEELTYVHSSGTFYLVINAFTTDWEVRVQEPREVKSSTQVTEKISLSNLQLVDQLGSRISSVSVGQQVILQSSVTNNQGVDQKFAYIMQVKDSDGITLMIAWINGEIPSSKIFDIGLSWIPENKGNYTVDVFVWQSIANPLPLSSKTLSRTIVVS